MPTPKKPNVHPPPKGKPNVQPPPPPLQQPPPPGHPPNDEAPSQAQGLSRRLDLLLVVAHVTGAVAWWYYFIRYFLPAQRDSRE